MQCITGVSDSSRPPVCINPPSTSLLGQTCDCDAPPSTLPPGLSCYCTSSNTCEYQLHQPATPASIQAYKNAWSCFSSASAPDGTSCTNPLTYAVRQSIVGSCAYYQCNKEWLAMVGSQLDLMDAPFANADHNPPCMQSVLKSYYAAAQQGQSALPCSLPRTWAALGWSCGNGGGGGSPSGPGSSGAGAAVGITMTVLAAGLGWYIYKGKKAGKTVKESLADLVPSCPPKWLSRSSGSSSSSSSSFSFGKSFATPAFSTSSSSSSSSASASISVLTGGDYGMNVPRSAASKGLGAERAKLLSSGSSTPTYQ